MTIGRPKAALVLTPDEREELESLTAPTKDVSISASDAD